jgi:hypothetical protein
MLFFFFLSLPFFPFPLFYQGMPKYEALRGPAIERNTVQESVIEMSPLAKRLEAGAGSDQEDGGTQTAARLRRPLLASSGSELAAEIVTELISKMQPADQRELAEMSRARFAASQCASIFISIMAFAAVLAFSFFNNGALLNLVLELANATLLANLPQRPLPEAAGERNDTELERQQQQP